VATGVWRMTERSGNEIQAMVLRAGRGAGLPLQNAQDIALACRWMRGQLKPVLDALKDATNPSRVAHMGPPLIDLALTRPGQPQDVPPEMAGELMQALCQEAAHRHGCALRLDVSQATITALDGNPPTPLAGARATVAPSVWDALGQFAARTYVPESDASRLSGAGAGLTDND